MGTLERLRQQVQSPSVEKPSIILETSGTEGIPKTVVLSYETLYASARIGQKMEALHAGDCWLNCLPQYQIGGLAIRYRCELAGATMLLHGSFNPQRIEQDCMRYAVTHLSLVPVMLSKLLHHFADGPPPATLRTVLMGGDRLPKSLALQAVKAGWPIVVSYGMTETASRITMLRLDVNNIGSWDEHDVGKPLPGVSLTIGGEGEVRIRSEQLFAGETREIVSGDAGAIDQRGHLHIHGRLDDQILSAGICIDPVEVEQRLQACPWVDSVGVAGCPDREWGALIVAVFEQPLDDAVKQWVREQMPSHLRPRRFIVVEQLQRTVSGKLDRHWLRKVVRNVA
ncbi:MAG: AMP-binding protein [Gammaproteobacteria bacterium]|jgi:O-succinylbenzoic acid--CoA ligase|nr:AMP-binding protein [Gammaproteobacteria bacterium]MBT3719798.1 AMP-binding protein [Gammaproteobacteria bacterium]MBT3845718.1 AMP-binding protein [Gammaproteobacteria bacterium]MBT3893659.1 AMP-binding protein [Gammaproteobacteria bacterium]MBT4300310.1 AMP-binding protein [Gammaproteobacteria bacterium]